MGLVQIADPKGSGFVIVNPHPGGVDAAIRGDIARISRAIPEPLPHGHGGQGLVLGNSGGYGLPIGVALARAGMRVYGNAFEMPPRLKDGFLRLVKPGWYGLNTVHQVFSDWTTVLGSAFRRAVVEKVIDLVSQSGEPLDLMVVALATPFRQDDDGRKWTSALKVTTHQPLEFVGLDYERRELKNIRVETATPEEIEATIRVMGGDVIEFWVGALLAAGLCSPRFKVLALSYEGPKDFDVLQTIYRRNGTIGRAKDHVLKTTVAMDQRLKEELGPGAGAYSVEAPSVATLASVRLPIGKYLADMLGVVDAGIGVFDSPADVAVRLARAMLGPRQSWQQMLEGGRIYLDGHERDPLLQEAVQELWRTAVPGRPQGLTASGLEILERIVNRLHGWDVPGYQYRGDDDKLSPVEAEPPLLENPRVHSLLDLPSPKKIETPTPVVLASTAGSVAPVIPPTGDRRDRDGGREEIPPVAAVETGMGSNTSGGDQGQGSQNPHGGSR